MSIPVIVICVLLLVLALFLIVAVLMQQGKSHNLSGTIAGGAETFFGKSKAQSMNKKLSVLTSAVAIVFVIAVLVLYFIQTPNDTLSWGNIFGDDDEVLVDETTATETKTEDPKETTTEDHDDHEGHDHE